MREREKCERVRERDTELEYNKVFDKARKGLHFFVSSSFNSNLLKKEACYGLKTIKQSSVV